MSAPSYFSPGMAKDNIKLAISRTACSGLTAVIDLSVHPGSASFMSYYILFSHKRSSMATKDAKCNWMATPDRELCPCKSVLALPTDEGHFRSLQLGLPFLSFLTFL